MNSNIRKAELSDMVILGDIYARASNGASRDESWTTESAKLFLTDFFKKQKDLFFVAETDGEVVGGTVGEIVNVDVGRCLKDVEIFVDPSHHSKGLGKSLLARLIAEALSIYDIKDVAFLADSRNSFPFSWYKKIGMDETGWHLLWGNAKEVLDNLKGR